MSRSVSPIGASSALAMIVAHAARPIGQDDDDAALRAPSHSLAGQEFAAPVKQDRARADDRQCRRAAYLDEAVFNFEYALPDDACFSDLEAALRDSDNPIAGAIAPETTMPGRDPGVDGAADGAITPERPRRVPGRGEGMGGRRGAETPGAERPAAVVYRRRLGGRARHLGRRSAPGRGLRSPPIAPLFRSIDRPDDGKF